jgi:uncharacterized protein
MSQHNNPSGGRAKHVPQRTCIACRRSETKRGLMRLVRDSEGRVTYDPRGKLPGRGAYLCDRPQCWEQALRRNGLARALKIEALHPDDQQTLLELVATLPPVVERRGGPTDV